MTVKLPMSLLQTEVDKKEIVLENLYKDKLKLENAIADVESEIIVCEETLNSFKEAVKILSKNKK